MTRFQLSEIFIQNGVLQTPILRSEAYDSIELEFIQECWDAAVLNLPPPMKVSFDLGGGKMQTRPKYVQPIFNCAAFSGWLGTYIDLCLTAVAIVKSTTPNTPMFGAITYLIGGVVGDGHAIDWFVDGNSNLRWFEPQTREEKTLTDVERASISFIVDT